MAEVSREELEDSLHDCLSQLRLVSLEELDSYLLDCGCCHKFDLTERPGYWQLIASIEGYRFLLGED